MEQIPAPIVSTPRDKENIEKILDSKSFDIKSNKKNIFEIKILKNINYLILEGKYKGSFESNIYYSKKNIEELKINKYFLMFDNLNEIYNEIINLIEINKPYLIEDTNNLLLYIPLSTTKIKEIILELNKKEKTDKEKIDDLYLIINNLKLHYNDQINELNKKIEKQNEKINYLQKIIENNNNKNIPGIFDDSLIINKNKNYISYLKKWISPNDHFTTQLLFRKSKNGDSFNEFHRLCDNKGKTLVLIEGEEGFIIGGYTTKDWNKSEKWYKDNDSFLFSLTQGKLFPNIENKDSIRGSEELGPWFAYIGFRDQGKQNLSQGKFHYISKGQESFENYNEIIPNDKCDKLFDVKEVEIYKITNA